MAKAKKHTEKRPLTPEKVDRSALDALHKIAAAFRELAMAAGQLVNIERQKLGMIEEQTELQRESVDIQRELAEQSKLYEGMLHAQDDDSGGELQ